MYGQSEQSNEIPVQPTMDQFKHRHWQVRREPNPSDPRSRTCAFWDWETHLVGIEQIWKVDAGRAAQNMLLTAWNDHIGSCPNGMPDPDAVADLLDLEEGERPTIVLTFGFPARTRDPLRREAIEWIERADRKPFDEVVQRL